MESQCPNSAVIPAEAVSKLPPSTLAPTPANPTPPAQETLVATSPSVQLALVVIIALMIALLGSFAVLNGSFASRPAPVLDHRLDLNRASRAELVLLPGIGPKLAERIHEYRFVHGPFRKVDDLLDVPGIGPSLLDRVRSDIYVEPERTQPAKNASPVAPRPWPTPVKQAPIILDPNTASAAQLDTLPGIGPTLAQRIIDERGKRSFGSVEELRRVKGIGPKTLEKVRPYIVIQPQTAQAPG